jgi:hypothetical protein
VPALVNNRQDGSITQRSVWLSNVFAGTFVSTHAYAK